MTPFTASLFDKLSISIYKQIFNHVHVVINLKLKKI